MSDIVIALFLLAYGGASICASGGNYFVIFVGLALCALALYTITQASLSLRRQARKARPR